MSYSDRRVLSKVTKIFKFIYNINLSHIILSLLNLNCYAKVIEAAIQDLFFACYSRYGKSIYY